MKSLFARVVGFVVLVAAVIVGCRSLYGPPPSGGGGGTGTPTAPPGSDPFASATGSFPPDSNDVPGASTPVQPQPDDAEEGEETASHFVSIQVDPVEEDTAGPKFVVAGDIDGDGLLDLATAWNQSQPVQIHLQRRDESGAIRFESVTIAGTLPVAIMAGLELADFDGDGGLDIAVLVKETGFTCTSNGEPIDDPSCILGEIVVYFHNEAEGSVNDGAAWQQVEITSSNLNGEIEPDRVFDEVKTEPEWAAYTAMDAGDVDGDGDADFVVAFNPFPFEDSGGRVDIYRNPGGSSASSGDVWPAPETVLQTPSFVKDVEFLDVDEDGNLDVISTFPNLVSPNVIWTRNTGGGTFTEFPIRPIGHLDRPPGDNVFGADVVTTGDMDGDGHVDVLVRSADRRVVQWFRHPDRDSLIEPLDPSCAPICPRQNYPWQVYTLVEDEVRDPQGIAVGDLTADGQVEAVVAIGGALQWFNSATAVNGIFSPWGSEFLLDDTKEQGTTADPTDPDFIDAATFINDVIIADLDGDGFGDIVATFDRRVISGLADDRLFWFRNTLGEQNAQ